MTTVAGAAALFCLSVGPRLDLAWILSAPEPASLVCYVLFGEGGHMTPVKLLIERVVGRSRGRLSPGSIAAPWPGVPCEELMIEPRDGRVTKLSLLVRTYAADLSHLSVTFSL